MKFITLADAMLATTSLTTTASANLSIAGSARIGVQQAEKTTANAAATTAVNRVRIEFAGTGSTDAGIEFGATIRADEAVNGNTGTAGSQWVSGAFGKISMGDLDGADEIAVGDVGGGSVLDWLPSRRLEEERWRCVAEIKKGNLFLYKSCLKAHNVAFVQGNVAFVQALAAFSLYLC